MASAPTTPARLIAVPPPPLPESAARGGAPVIGTSARPDLEAPPLIARPVFLLLGTGVALLVLLIAALIAVATVVSATPTNVTLDLPSGSSELKLDDELRASLSGWNTHLEHVALFETPTGADGRPGPERTLAVQAT